ncbi:short-chain dehydrogenase/reductase family protein [Apiospora sp. TS-2023a]
MPSSMDLPPPMESYFRMLMRAQFIKDVPPPDHLNLAGQTGIITGATGGIGLETAHVLLEHGLARLIITTRNPDKGQEVVAALKKSFPLAKMAVWPLDMQSYESIQTFVGQCRSSLDTIDFVILNAGVMTTGYSANKDTGYEEMLQVNYVSTVLLARLLRPVLREKRRDGKKPNRLTLVGSSIAHAAQFPEKDNPQNTSILRALSERDGWGMAVAMDRYMTSKLLLMCFLIRFQDLVDPNELTVNLVCPGNVRATGLGRGMPGWIQTLTRWQKTLTGRSVRAAAWTEVDAAVVKGAESHGCFIVDWKISPFVQLLYTPEGEQLTERLWKDTLQEFQGAGVNGTGGM